MKKILLLGASGSIGTQTVDIIKEHKDQLQLVGASVGSKTDYLETLLEEFSLEFVYSINEQSELASKYPNTRFYFGDKGLEEIVLEENYDLLVNALVGFTGFKPTLLAVQNKKDIALANKETLVAGGDIINQAVKENGVTLLPIDSEHSAILQCLQGHRREDVKRLIITASGGAFRNKSRAELANVTLEDALNHPTWSMGNKITIDSATMMNKGFEIMEAHYLFDIPYSKITPVIHPESIIHSMVEFNDGTIMAQMSNPDMRLPIRYALLYPNNVGDSCVKTMDFDKMFSMTFKPVDYSRYPLVKIAKEIGGFGGNFGSILNGANDEAVDLFLKGHIKFNEIENYVIKTLKKAHFIKHPSAEELVSYNKWAKEFVRNIWANN
ncbi:MAG: 1-deoxy-D-xylulose-5-phosphate reductoisomerase [Erysipelotrichaceae bacterium]|nr:1-deoxy-D-xylulose-5-phosphate reductoisomerase [Erysipelotrichaceae bacterium]